MGTLAVFTLTFVTITYPCTTNERLIISVFSAIAEAVGGDYDNLALALVVLTGWQKFGLKNI
jgi:hypothetical protein